MELINYKNEFSFSSEFNIIASKNGTILIDAGFYDDKIKQKLKEIGSVDAILLTHGHWDHIQAIDKIIEDFPNAKVYIHENDYEFLTKEELNLSYKFGFNLYIKTGAIKLKEECFSVGKYNIKLIHTPGHTGGSCMYYFEEENILFTGDTIGPGTIGNTYYPTGSDYDMKNTLFKFKNLNLPSNTICYSSHWGHDTFENLINNNPFL